MESLLNIAGWFVIIGLPLALCWFVLRWGFRSELPRPCGEPTISQSTMYPDVWHCSGYKWTRQNKVRAVFAVGRTPDEALENWILACKAG